MITLKNVREIISAAEKRALQIGQPTNIAIVHSGANLITHSRMDGTSIGGINISLNKAFTARALDISTKGLAIHSQPGKQFFGIRASNRGRDQTVAEAGAAAFKPS
jgi:uncharacterized protein GlcG (DUF336 family)